MSADLSRHVSRAWIVTDGKAGDLAQCLGVAQCLGLSPALRTVAPRAPFTWAMPWGPVDPREAPSRAGSPIAPPFPDLLIASGRRAVPYLRRVRRDGAARTFTVFLKDPRSGARTADFIWVPAHDRLRGPNVMATLTSPHAIRAAEVEALRAALPPEIEALPSPELTVLLGGPNAGFHYDEAAIEAFAQRLRSAARDAGSVLLSPSRRTPPALLAAAEAALAGTPSLVWRGEGENPYRAFLSAADILIVTADSVNMVGEALSLGRPVLIFTPPGRPGRIGLFLDTLKAQGLVRELSGKLEFRAVEAIDTTPAIASEIARRYREWEAGGRRS